MQIGAINAKNDAERGARAYYQRTYTRKEISSRAIRRDLATVTQRHNFFNEKESVKNDLLTCRTKNCSYTGPVLHFAFIYGTTLCPKCATKKVWIEGNRTTYSGKR